MLYKVRSDAVLFDSLLRTHIEYCLTRVGRLFGCAEGCQQRSHLLLRFSAAVKRPTERRAIPDGVPDVLPRAAVDQQPYYWLVASGDGLVQWRRVGVIAFEVIAVRVLASIEQQANNVRMSVVGSQGESAVARFGIGGREQTAGGVQESQSGGAR